jgi:beta-N-acetylhexosaminidase
MGRSKVTQATIWRRRVAALGALGLISGVVAGVIAGGGGSSHHAGRVASGASSAPKQGGVVQSLKRAAGAKGGSGLARQAARLFMVGFGGASPTNPFVAATRAQGWGAVILDRVNYTGPQQLQALTAALRKAAADGHQPEPLIAAAQLGGEDSAFPGLPPAPQSATAGTLDAHRQARAAGRRLRELGVDVTLAPAADLADAAGAWAGRGFADDPTVVSQDVVAAEQGYREAHIASVVGHFPGEGGASGDPVEGPATVGLTLDQLKARDVLPFMAVVSTAPGIQVSSAMYAAWDGVTPATVLPAAIGLLRGAGFRGTVVSGDLQAVALVNGGTVADAAVDALKAGCDLLYVPGDQAAEARALRAVQAAIRTGAIPTARVTAALAHVQALRRAAGRS